MAVQLKQRMTAQEFEVFVGLPENSDNLFEYIAGKVFEVPSNPYVSKVAGWILTALNNFLRQHDLGHVTGADGGYMVNGDLYAPDVAYISYERQPELARQGFNPHPPELAVEVISDPQNSQEQATLRHKIVNYLAAGTVVWVVDAFEQTVEVYEGIQQVQVYHAEDTLTGGAWLPGFELKLSDLFPQQAE